MVIGPGRVNFTGLSVAARRNLACSAKTGRARYRADHHGHIGVVAVADAHRLLVREIDPVQILDQSGDEMPACLLAVADDVDAGRLLVAQHQAHRILHALGERLALEQPGRPELVRLGQPGGFGQAADDGGLQYGWFHDALLKLFR